MIFGRKQWLLAVSFVEGGAVMAVELVGAKMVAPYFGNTVYVWAAVLGLTLSGLATGYFIGGKLSEKHPSPRFLHQVILLTAFSIAIMPFTSHWIMEATVQSLSLQMGVTISCLLFLFPPLVCCGTVSPLIIRLLSTELEKVGRSAGTVYAISTLGGILFTFIIGMWAIQELGLKASAWWMAGLLGLMGVLGLLDKK